MRSSRLRSIIAAGAIAASAIGVMASPASAMPRSEIESECHAANGGHFTTLYENGHLSGYACDYRDSGGTTWRDVYSDRGSYAFTCRRAGGHYVDCE